MWCSSRHLPCRWSRSCVRISIVAASEVDSQNSASKTNCWLCWSRSENIALSFILRPVGESVSQPCVASPTKVETLLMRSGKFRLPGKKQLYANAYTWNVLVVDVTESPIERPKKKQRGYYSGKKKRHTLKAQVVVNQANGQIICTAFGKGRVHD